MGALDFDDPMVRTAAAALRRECTEAKEALSADTEVTIPVMLPGVSTRVRMVRAEFEQLIAPAIDATVEAMRRACDVGRAGRRRTCPRCCWSAARPGFRWWPNRSSAALDRPVTVDSDPKAVVAAGAALAIAPRKEIVPAQRRPLALLPSAGTADPAGSPHRSRKRAGYALVGMAAFAAAMIGLAGIVGSDVRPLGDIAAEEGIVAPAPGQDAGRRYRDVQGRRRSLDRRAVHGDQRPGPDPRRREADGGNPGEALAQADEGPQPRRAHRRRDATPPPNTGGGDNGGGDPDPGTEVPVDNSSVRRRATGDDHHRGRSATA